MKQIRMIRKTLRNWRTYNIHALRFKRLGELQASTRWKMVADRTANRARKLAECDPELAEIVEAILQIPVTDPAMESRDSHVTDTRDVTQESDSHVTDHVT